MQDLGVNTIWLLPFYPSPLRDDGYDIADYHNVHPDYGTRPDFRLFVREAHRRGLRVITELVINHTSDQHPWFQAARRAPAGLAQARLLRLERRPEQVRRARASSSPTPRRRTGPGTGGQGLLLAPLLHPPAGPQLRQPARAEGGDPRRCASGSTWASTACASTPSPTSCEREGTNNENLPETHAVLKTIRARLDANYRGRLLLAEANQWPEDVREYFGDGDECHMAYHFPLMPRMYMAIAQEDRHPIVEIMQQTPEIPANCQWAIFLRNHDELTLEMVTSRERDYMYRMYAADPRARINLGIRRRLAPLMDNDPARIELMNSLLLSMPGTPIIYYGDEIGMGDNIFLGDRNGVRTPMQWSPDRNAGFSRADPQRLYLPPIMDPVYGFEAVNVEAQPRDAVVAAELDAPDARGAPDEPRLRPRQADLPRAGQPQGARLPARARGRGDPVRGQPVPLGAAGRARPAPLQGRVPVEMLGRTAFPPIGELPYLLTLPAHGFYWFRLSADVEVPSWHEERLAARGPAACWCCSTAGPASSATASCRGASRMADETREQLEQEVLPRFLAAQRWYGGQGRAGRARAARRPRAVEARRQRHG